nr:MAG TPA: hypothetical protein [Caudoviricetes sp.]
MVRYYNNDPIEGFNISKGEYFNEKWAVEVKTYPYHNIEVQ